MTSHARAARRRAARDAALPARRRDEWHSIVVGWSADDEHLQEVQKGTHDAVIDLMGDERTGGVTWRIFRDITAAGKALELLADGASPDLLHHYRTIRGLLREHGGIMVMASAPGNRP